MKLHRDFHEARNGRAARDIPNVSKKDLNSDPPCACAVNAGTDSAEHDGEQQQISKATSKPAWVKASAMPSDTIEP